MMGREGRYWKLFRLLGSDNEAEAASALRSLKSMLKSQGLSWNQFTDRIVEIDGLADNVMSSQSLDEFMELMKRELKIK
jgi:hypothetical protein